MTTYPHNAKLHRTTPNLTIATFTYKRQFGSKHILEDANSVTVSVSEQQLSSYSLSRRMVLTELEETLRQKIDRVHSELREAGIAYNPLDKPWIVAVTNANPPKEVHQYCKKSGRYIQSFPSVAEASKATSPTGVYSGHISAVCNGKWKSAYGYKWSFEKRNFFQLNLR